ncbi:P-type conjugative transfer ATPase TrbB [Fusobacterium necrophorum]|uniref:Bacterial type II secretion system protein E domain-containing protein n=2 Tax=Fusobacterium necrophorum TaxID=859 RepID=A0AB73BTF7_9FUSO|nr:P-type conjugative transfer ATPase TrbB [Fusobacterium necrophorum]AYZ74517.1 P-type conjugative transfer ATPase TrbB [Fusobacterium necrophorum]AZW09600.1 P-type conjugative transfer ATPase TrbB [Fusobacterium necrophorum subsp. necrophorum]KDE60977.1 hypothetical protein FUSO3_11490 [Fusobacterium necrophorum BL]KDE64331.1 hypothetical protein FUSO5_06540 [Fusobacterium necrophorum BFTR-1]KDE68679.1 hypothetical protein FUSO6_08190 [Fusobacterium necrophorum DAB]
MNILNSEIEKNNLINARKKQLLDELLGEDLKKYLWEDDNITEIQVNADNRIWIDTFTEGNIWTGKFFDPEKSKQLINYIASDIGLELGVGQRIVTGRIPFTLERFEGILPPVSKPNALFVIRKKPVKIFSLDDYVSVGSMSEMQKEILAKAISEYKNILVVGPTASGKTTFCNALIKEMEQYNDRLIFLEETPELLSENLNSIFLETAEGIELLRLFKSTMRLSPVRIIVGEVRGSEAIELLTAWNSGHSGGVSTIHSDSAIGGLRQLERYIKRQSLDSQSETIAITIHYIVVIAKISGKRKVKEIVKIKGYQNGDYILETVE